MDLFFRRRIFFAVYRFSRPCAFASAYCFGALRSLWAVDSHLIKRLAWLLLVTAMLYTNSMAEAPAEETGAGSSIGAGERVKDEP